MQRLGVLHSRFFWKLFLTYTFLFAVLTSVVGWEVYQQFQKALSRNLTSSLERNIDFIVPLATDLFAGNPRSDLLESITKMGIATDTRISFIDASGAVRVDSDHQIQGMDNHLSRPEIIDANTVGIGYAQRWSETMNANLLYVARAVRINNVTVGYVRVAFTKSNLERDLLQIRDQIIFAALVGVFIALMIAFYIARRVAIPISEMMRVCDAMRQGHYDERVTTITGDEIGRLGDTLNRLGAEITNKISQISLERAQLKTMLTGMVEGIIAVDDEDRIKFCNRAAYTLIGSSLTDARGLTLAEVSGFDLLKAVSRRAREKRELIEDEVLIDVDSSNRLLEIHASFFEGIDANGVIIVLHDVTKVRHLEKMRRDFVANVSHEIKTPLTSIKGYVETLQNDSEIDATTQTRFLGKIERNADRLMTLVQDILSLAQIESHEGQLPLKPTDVGVVLRQVISQYDDQVHTKELDIVIKEVTKPLVVMGDRESLFQVLDNLYTNAVRYTPRGGKISILVYDDGDNGHVEVSDTGIGIPKKYLARIFERFYRVDKARSRELGGTGLGLSIVKHLMSSMGGTIAVESEVGLGSKFTVSLPLAR